MIKVSLLLTEEVEEIKLTMKHSLRSIKQTDSGRVDHLEDNNTSIENQMLHLN